MLTRVSHASELLPSVSINHDNIDGRFEVVLEQDDHRAPLVTRPKAWSSLALIHIN